MTVDEMKDVFCGSGVADCGSDDLTSYFDGSSQMLSQMIADLAKCWYVILASVGIALVVGFVYLCVMKYCTLCVVFSGLLLVIVSLAATTLAFYWYYTELKKTTEIEPQLATYDTDVTYMNICLGVTIFFACCTAIITCIVVCMCKQIRVACTVLALAADGVMDMPLLLFYPIGISLCLMLVTVVWTYGALYLATAGDVATEEVYGYAVFSYTDNLKYGAVYWLFGLLWISEFITSVGFMVVAMCFCIWFFTPVGDSSGRNPVLQQVHYSDEPEGKPADGGNNALRFTGEEMDYFYECPCCCCPRLCALKEPTTEAFAVDGGGIGPEKGNDFERAYSELLDKELGGTITPEETSRLADMKVTKENIAAQNMFLKKDHDEFMKGRQVSQTGRLMPSCILYDAIKCTCLHHLGTVAFGSFIIAVIQLLRLILEYVEQKYKEMNGGEIPCHWKFIFCILRCCLWCLEKCMKFLNKNAYILTCINGTSFCSSACHAAKVLIGGLDYVFITVTITQGMLIFGKLAIAMFTAAIAGYWCNTVDDVTSILLPTFLTLLVGYAIALMFCQVYEMGIDTVLMCYLEAVDQKLPPSTLPPSIRTFVSSQEDEHHERQKQKKQSKTTTNPTAESKAAGVELDDRVDSV